MQVICSDPWLAKVISASGALCVCIHFVISYGSVTVLSVMEGQQLCTLLNRSVGPNSDQTVPSHALSEMAFLPPRVLGHSSKYVI